MSHPTVQRILGLLRGLNLSTEEAGEIRTLVDLCTRGGQQCSQVDLLGSQCLRTPHYADPELPNLGHVFDVKDPLEVITQEVGSELADGLAQWWRDTAESEIAQTVAKATEYSGTGGGLPLDLVNQGREWMFVSGRDLADYTDAQLAEIGVWSYMIGKLGRWSSALRNGRPVSDDTLLDLGVYVRIAQRIRSTGQWP